MKQFLRMTALILSAVLAVFLFLTPGMAAAGSPLYSAGSLFTDRDLKQEADLSGAPAQNKAQHQDRAKKPQSADRTVQQPQGQGGEPVCPFQAEVQGIHRLSPLPRLSISSRSSRISSSERDLRRVKAARKAGTEPPKEVSTNCSLRAER